MRSAMSKGPSASASIVGKSGLGRQPGERWTRFAARVANAFGLVLLLVVATYVLASLIPYSGWTGVVVVVVGVASAVVGLATAEARHTVVRIAALLAAIAVVLAVVNAIADASEPLAFAALLQALLLVAAAGAILRAVLNESEVGFPTILGAISVYLMLGLLFTFLYASIEKLQEGLFFGQATETGDFLFFSFTTLTTTGYGNLVPVAQPGKMVSVLEMLIGQIFLVTLIAGLVSLWRPGSPRAP
jgi:Ion channel